MFFDLINDALSKAKSELERSVDDVLKQGGAGLQSWTGSGQTTAATAEPSSNPVITSQGSGQTLQPVAEEGNPNANNSAQSNTAAASTEGNGPATTAAATTSQPKTRKVVKKVIKRVIKNPDGTTTTITRPAPDTPATPAPTPSTPATGLNKTFSLPLQASEEPQLNAQSTPNAVAGDTTGPNAQANNIIDLTSDAPPEPVSARQPGEAITNGWEGQGLDVALPSNDVVAKENQQDNGEIPPQPDASSRSPFDSSAPQQEAVAPVSQDANGWDDFDMGQANLDDSVSNSVQGSFSIGQATQEPVAVLHPPPQIQDASTHDVQAVQQETLVGVDSQHTQALDDSCLQVAQDVPSSGDTSSLQHEQQVEQEHQQQQEQQHDSPCLLETVPQTSSSSPDLEPTQHQDSSPQEEQPNIPPAQEQDVPHSIDTGIVESSTEHSIEIETHKQSQAEVHTDELPLGWEQLPPAGLIELVNKLHTGVAARDHVISDRDMQVARLEGMVASLTAKNEQLALKSARISEQDWEEMRQEFEQRLAAAERKVYALTKERDALKRGNEKLSDYSALIKEKDTIIKQVMQEGERLSAKQGDMEAAARKLRAQIKELEAEKDRLVSRLSIEESTCESLRKAKAKLERELQAAQESSAAELEALKQHTDGLLKEARTQQAEAEERAREAAAAGLVKKLRESEARCEALNDSVGELREALDRQRQAADLREEMLKQDISDLERRCQAAEVRHQELTAKLPETTRPLLRQIEAMQAAADAQSQAWSQVEQGLMSRCEEAEGRAAAAAERERHAIERAQGLQTRIAGLEAALAATRAELKSVSDAAQQHDAVVARVTEQLAAAQQALQLEAEHAKLARQQLAQLEEKHSQAIAFEHQSRIAAETDAATQCRELQQRVAELESQLADSSVGKAAGEPPVMAAPGYKWVLVKEGEQQAAGAGGGGGGGGSLPSRTSIKQPLSSTNSQDRASLARRNSVGAVDAEAAQRPMSDMQSELLSSLGPSGLNGGVPLASELEAMRAALRIRNGEVATLEAQVKSLELTRDRLSEELVAAAQKSEEAASSLVGLQELRHEIEELKSRYTAAVELLGERDEELEELRADLRDVKNLYRDQIEFMVMQLTNREGPDATGAATGSITRIDEDS